MSGYFEVLVYQNFTKNEVKIWEGLRRSKKWRFRYYAGK